METISTEIKPFLSYNYYCEKCDYGTSKKSNYNNHCESKKHNFNVLTTNSTAFKPILSSTKYHCDICNKNYTDRSGLWKHKKICIPIEEEQTEENGYYEGVNIKDKDALVLHLLKQNGELQKSLIEMSKDKSITNNNTNNTNCHNTNNNAFNLNFFLNETCKDALNITDFVSSIKLSLDDLENTGRKGYIEGISNIILKQLNKLGHYDRPIHCADQKREVLYIKNDNQWFKETEEKPILTKAIKTIANENIKQIKTWREQNPDCTVSDSKKNSLYLKIVSNSMSGSDKEECDKNLNKIISNVAKETIIPKEGPL
jgi:transcriptional regulator with PAS, ATPase and Fis domain